MRTAICSGSFDPITLGHTDIIRRAAACFDQVCVCVVPNAEKKNQMFTPEQKLELVRQAVAPLPNVEAELWPGLLVDRRKDAVTLIRENLRITGLQDRARVVQGDAQEYLNSLREHFDLIFLDPPYEAGLLEPALAHIARFDILSPHGIILAEPPADRVLPALAPPYFIHRTYRHGKIGLTGTHRPGTGEPPQ